ncbi:hypothetical protein [uncultured Tateyamaria sp.]|nr:hypothetical protein [uncultured Tateyamaria sp.]
MSGTSQDDVANYLASVAEVHMGLGPARNQTRKNEIAAKIAAPLN